MSGQIGRCNEELEKLAEEIPRLPSTEIPGVGLIAAMYFVFTVDDPQRFRNSRDVAAFFGLRPSMRESGGTHSYGSITKEGDPEMRRLLIQAAHGLMHSRRDCALKTWAKLMEERRGKSKAGRAGRQANSPS